MGEFKKKFIEMIPSSSHYDRNVDSLTFKGIKRTVAIAEQLLPTDEEASDVVRRTVFTLAEECMAWCERQNTFTRPNEHKPPTVCLMSCALDKTLFVRYVKIHRTIRAETLTDPTRRFIDEDDFTPQSIDEHPTIMEITQQI